MKSIFKFYVLFMKQVFSVCVFAVLCVLQFSCVHDKEVEHIVSNAEQLLNTNPDSSLFILDNIREDKSTWSRSQQMRYELVYAQAQNKAFVNAERESFADLLYIVLMIYHFLLKVVLLLTDWEFCVRMICLK